MHTARLGADPAARPNYQSIGIIIRIVAAGTACIVPTTSLSLALGVGPGGAGVPNLRDDLRRLAAMRLRFAAALLL